MLPRQVHHRSCLSLPAMCRPSLHPMPSLPWLIYNLQGHCDDATHQTLT